MIKVTKSYIIDYLGPTVTYSPDYKEELQGLIYKSAVDLFNIDSSTAFRFSEWLTSVLVGESAQESFSESDEYFFSATIQDLYSFKSFFGSIGMGLRSATKAATTKGAASLNKVTQRATGKLGQVNTTGGFKNRITAVTQGFKAGKSNYGSLVQKGRNIQAGQVKNQITGWNITGKASVENKNRTTPLMMKSATTPSTSTGLKLNPGTPSAPSTNGPTKSGYNPVATNTTKDKAVGTYAKAKTAVSQDVKSMKRGGVTDWISKNPGKTAIGAGVAAAGAYGVYRALRGPRQAPPTQPAQSQPRPINQSNNISR